MADVTQAQRDRAAAAFQAYIERQQGVAETFMGNAFAHGREATAELAGADVVTGALEQARIDSLIQDNFDLITGQAGRASDTVMTVVSEAYQAGNAPDEVERALRNEIGAVENNWGVIARDQVAKAQFEGRNATYSQIGTSQVEVTCAPDACDECTPQDGDIVDVLDVGGRPQFH